MPRSRSIDEYIKDTKYVLAKYEAVKAVFPEAKSTYFMDFSCKSVNAQYTGLEFESRYSGLFVSPYCEIIFNYNDREEIIKVHSSPKSSRLVYLQRWGRTVGNKKIMKFSRLNINLKNNKFKDEMVKACHAEIIKFIANNPGYHLDTKYLEPRLKKLLLFI